MAGVVPWSAAATRATAGVPLAYQGRISCALVGRRALTVLPVLGVDLSQPIRQPLSQPKRQACPALQDEAGVGRGFCSVPVNQNASC